MLDVRWSLFVPTEMRGATLGIIGYGSIGRELARIAKAAFAMTVLACKREPSRRADPGYHLPGTGDPEGVLPDESVDEVALAHALAEKRLAGAAVDVFAQEPPPVGHPLYGLDNVILSPHVSGFVASYDDRCAGLFAENLQRYLDGAPLLNLVDRAKGY
jgi:phosphoglycerate dehydrogenase-like enzyme